MKGFENIYGSVRSLAFMVGLVVAAGTAWAQDDPWRSVICQPGYSASLRLHGAARRITRDKAFARAGIPVSQQCHHRDTRPNCAVLDHIRPLELCRPQDDCNGLDNLQVQLRADAKRKDLKENLERRRYCRGEPLSQVVAGFHRSTR